mmetsp:Transcript_19307/g.56341  ORF Transcript_19307/g.56341 Transcript_19307/m.56341 type:complete len:239 (-) Transcript_19307:478-1194(-)
MSVVAQLQRLAESARAVVVVVASPGEGLSDLLPSASVPVGSVHPRLPAVGASVRRSRRHDGAVPGERDRLSEFFSRRAADHGTRVAAVVVAVISSSPQPPLADEGDVVVHAHRPPLVVVSIIPDGEDGTVPIQVDGPPISQVRVPGLSEDRFSHRYPSACGVVVVVVVVVVVIAIVIVIIPLAVDPLVHSHQSPPPLTVDDIINLVVRVMRKRRRDALTVPRQYGVGDGLVEVSFALE